MKFEFDSNNATELRAVEAAVAVLLGKQSAAPTNSEWETAIEVPELHPDNFKSPLVAAVVEAQQKLESAQPPTSNPFFEDTPSPLGEALTGEILVPSPPAEDLDSAGQPWNPELHSSSRAKVADGTWKKKRGVGKAPDAQQIGDFSDIERRAAEVLSSPVHGDGPTTGRMTETAPQKQAAPPVPPAPAVPTPPAPQADGLVTMNDIWALITNGKTTINVVLAAAQRMGFADLGKVAQTATAEQRAALLKELTA